MASGLVGKLAVTVHCAKDLKDVQIIGKQDPYTVLTIGNEQFRTRVIKNGGKNPVWDQSFVFNLTGVEDALHVKIKAQETTLGDRSLGRCDIPLRELVNKACNHVHTFQVLNINNFSKMAGQLLMSVEFIEIGMSCTKSTPIITTTTTTIQQAPPSYESIYQQPCQSVYKPPIQIYQQPPQHSPQVVVMEQPRTSIVYTPPLVANQPQVIYGQPQPSPQVIFGHPSPQVRYY